MKKITFNSPIFSCKSHQEIFFGRLRDLSSYKLVLGYDNDIRLMLNEPVDKQTIEELTEIFNHWAIDTSALHNLSI